MACCVVARREQVPAAAPTVAPGAAADAPTNLIPIGACTFTMGSEGRDAVPADGEGPVRRVSLDNFSIAATTVTNHAFGEFVRATRYVTDAERLGSSFVFYLQVPLEYRQHVRQAVTDTPWWLPLADASWQRPEGPGSHIYQRIDHPVVHVSWNDATAYCTWRPLSLGRRPHAKRRAALQRLAWVVPKRTRGRLAAGARCRHRWRAQRIGPDQCLRQCVGMVRRLVQLGLSP